MTVSSSKKHVVCHSVSVVAPAHPVPPYDYFLSNFDLFFVSAPMYWQTVYYFRTKTIDPETPSTQSLKASLSKALSIYPILAGRLKMGDAGRIEVDVNGKGIPFIEASTEASLDDWTSLHVCDIEEDLNPKNAFITNIFTAPLIRVQFTTFICGGIALGFSSLHTIGDGLAITEFVKTWGEIHRGAQISTPPHFESIKLMARNPPIANIPSADKVLSACIPAANYDLPTVPEQKSLRYKNVSFPIERHMIDKCIEHVEGGAFSYGSSTSFEALSALFWAVVTRAQGVEDSAMTTYIFPMNVRGRSQPPLPKGYFGNSIILNQASATAKDIKSNHFSFAASLIRKRKQMMEPEFVQSAIDWMELRLQQQQEIGENFGTSTESKLMNTSFANFPVYDTDFGWRKLDHFEFTILDEIPVDGLLYIMPPPPDASKHSRVVKLRLREDHLKHLLHDPDFLLFFPTKEC